MAETSAPQDKPARPTKNRARPLYVYVTEQQREAIEKTAKQVDMSVSSYLAAVGSNQPIRSSVDAGVAMDLVRINGDLGRLGGLLKLWLSGDRRGVGATPIQVNRVLNDINELAQELRSKASELRRK